MYASLRAAAGHRHWWPGRSRLEIILGAILTQNTSWMNVEKTLLALRRDGLLRLEGLRACPEARLAELLRPSGYFRQKARKLRAFLTLLDREYGGALKRMARRPTPELRRDLLGVWGIGPETADSILLYAFRRPVFVVDAYTLRVLTRHGMLAEGTSYADAQAYLTRRLPEDEPLFNDFHAQFVWVGQRHCRPQALCTGCPLEPLLASKGRGVL
jgi:endonuclease III related protein